MAAREQGSLQSSEALFRELEDYPWAEDLEFQAGLKAILGPEPEKLASDQSEDLALRARCFYYSRKHASSVDFAAYKSWRQSQAHEPASAVSDMNASSFVSSETQVSLSFVEVMDLVREGKQVPGIHDIPDTVLEGQSTEATRPERQKPWERARMNENDEQPRLFNFSGPK